MRHRILVLLLVVPLIACSNGITDVGLPERDGDPDLTALTAELIAEGGTVYVHLTGQPNDRVVADLESVGLEEVKPYPALDVVYAVMPPNTAYAVAERRYVTMIQPADKGGLPTTQGDG